MKIAFSFAVLEILLFEGRLLFSRAQWMTGREGKTKFSVKNKKIVQLLLKSLEKIF